jgi:hypothetical protein
MRADKYGVVGWRTTDNELTVMRPLCGCAA